MKIPICCKRRRVGNGYESCNFFRWYDVEDPHGWQHLALLEARDIIREKKEEIAKLREKVRPLTHALKIWRFQVN